MLNVHLIFLFEGMLLFDGSLSILLLKLMSDVTLYLNQIMSVFKTKVSTFFSVKGHIVNILGFAGHLCQRHRSNP